MRTMAGAVVWSQRLVWTTHVYYAGEAAAGFVTETKDDILVPDVAFCATNKFDISLFPA